MKIKDILAEGRPTLSFEVFPPKTADAYESVEKAASKIAQLKPDFMSVTYGAGCTNTEIPCFFNLTDQLRSIVINFRCFSVLWDITPQCQDIFDLMCL